MARGRPRDFRCHNAAANAVRLSPIHAAPHAFGAAGIERRCASAGNRAERRSAALPAQRSATRKKLWLDRPQQRRGPHSDQPRDEASRRAGLIGMANAMTFTVHYAGRRMWREWIPFWHPGVSPHGGDVDLLFAGLL